MKIGYLKVDHVFLDNKRSTYYSDSYYTIKSKSNLSKFTVYFARYNNLLFWGFYYFLVLTFVNSLIWLMLVLLTEYQQYFHDCMQVLNPSFFQEDPRLLQICCLNISSPFVARYIH